MDQTAPHSARTEHLAPSQGEVGTAMPTCIAAILGVVRMLLGYAKHLDLVLPERVEHPHFACIAYGFGTHDLRRILGHVHRGILRAMMLERYLLARAAQGRDIEPTQPPGPAEPEDIAALDMKLRAPARPHNKTPRASRVDPDDPMRFSMPTLKELEAQVRSRPIGRTIAEICMDLGIAANMCDGAMWTELYAAMVHFGGNFAEFFGVQERRRKAFKKERERRSGTWDRDDLKDAIRQLLGHLLGESPPRGPPDPQLRSALS
ncbi:MAG: hypothetical protein WCI94_10865 [Rhodospirillales bacterium]